MEQTVGGEVNRRLRNIIGRHGGNPGSADPFAGPPEMVGVSGRGELIAIEDGADIAGWLDGEGVAGEQAEGVGVVMEEF